VALGQSLKVAAALAAVMVPEMATAQQAPTAGITEMAATLAREFEQLAKEKSRRPSGA
jgi:hypothetical protein